MLTSSQLAVLAADIANDPAFTGLVPGSNSAYFIAAAYDQPASPAVNVWDSNVSVDRIHDAIDYTKYTPAVAVDGTTTYSNYVLQIQTKQMNLQNMIMGRTQIDARKANIRNGLKDATTLIPAGAAWANVNPGGVSGVNVLNAMLRSTQATRAEKLFSSGSFTTGTVTAESLVFEGPLNYEDVKSALGW